MTAQLGETGRAFVANSTVMTILAIERNLAIENGPTAKSAACTALREREGPSFWRVVFGGYD